MDKLIKNSIASIIVFINLPLINIAIADPFVTIWRTERTNEVITIPITGTGYNYAIDWNNDGEFEQTDITSEVSHKYTEIGDHTITIQGDFPRIYINNGTEKHKIISVEQWGTGKWISMASAFYGAKYLVVNAADAPDLSTVTDMSQMFRGATAFNQNINHWDVSNVNDMSEMFFMAEKFNQPLNNWDVSNVVNMRSMFFEAFAFNQAIDRWNVINVTNMREMFKGAVLFNQPLDNWEIRNVENMCGMLDDATAFNQDIAGWNVEPCKKKGDGGIKF